MGRLAMVFSKHSAGAGMKFCKTTDDESDAGMRVLILTPRAFPDISGNAITVERWRRALTEQGIAVSVLACAGLESPALRNHLEQFRPDIIHIHHAFKSGALMLHTLSEMASLRVAIVASPGGTDINEDLETVGKKEIINKVFELARVIIAQSPGVMERLENLLPATKQKLICVPKAVCWFGADPFDLRTMVECGPENILFFLPSGIRPVKGNVECLRVMKRVYDLRPNTRFAAAGPSIDSEYAGVFAREVGSHHSFARWIAAIPPSAMRSAYQGADIVLNASLSEGLSNALIEAIAADCPVLASDIPGNRWPVLGTNGDLPVGLLFDPNNSEDFVGKALKLIDDGVLRESFRQAARLRRSTWPKQEDEGKGLAAAYRAALAEKLPS
jgi:L-malate glycosyltransferase